MTEAWPNSRADQFEVVVVGAGQAGLAAGYYVVDTIAARGRH
jgi:cation diffusion facilitator CzcD-associated flavoprotein CzcO